MLSLQLKYWGVLSFFIFLASCQQDVLFPDLSSEELAETYRPTLEAYKGDQAVQLNWAWYTYNVPTYPNRVDPQKFEVWASEEDTSSFSKITELDKGISTYTLTGLKNEVAYFFQIKAKAAGAKIASSNRVMIIPGEEAQVNKLFPNDFRDRSWGSWSDENTIVYMSESSSLASPASPGRAIYEINLTTDSEGWLVDGAKPDPSPDGSQVVFETDMETNFHDKSSKTFISIFNRNNGSSAKIFGGDAYHHEPTWSPDGMTMLFTSNLDGADNFKLYSFPLDGSVSASAIKLTEDFSDLEALTTEEDRSPGHFSWSADGTKIIYSRFEMKSESFAQDIFEIQATGGNEIPIISSEWNDSHPAYSKDGKYLAFISDRSGTEAIWVLQIENGRLLQVTGAPSTSVSTVDSKLDWSPSGKSILFSSPVTDQINTLKTIAFP